MNLVYYHVSVYVDELEIGFTSSLEKESSQEQMSTIQGKISSLKSGQMILIRSAVPADAPPLLELECVMLQEGTFVITTSQKFEQTAEQEAHWINLQNTARGNLIIVAEADGVLIGFLNFRNGLRKRLAHQGAFGMSVSRAWRDQGVGRALLEALIVWGETEPGIDKLRLEVFATNERALHLYRAVGFQEEGRSVKQVKMEDGSMIDLLLMSKFVKE
jgi:RimJ/RimL family protein N-acetyltransferase